MAGAKGRRWKCRSRPCSACRRWFTPDPRAGGRQTVCKREECGRERHRRACARWRAANPDYDREERLRQKVRPPVEAAAAQIDWQAARDAVGLEVAVLVEEVSQVLIERSRDAVVPQAAVLKGKASQVPRRAARDDMAPRARPP